jgi:hypothetical protein
VPGPAAQERRDTALRDTALRSVTHRHDVESLDDVLFAGRHAAWYAHRGPEDEGEREDAAPGLRLQPLPHHALLHDGAHHLRLDILLRVHRRRRLRIRLLRILLLRVGLLRVGLLRVWLRRARDVGDHILRLRARNVSRSATRHLRQVSASGDAGRALATECPPPRALPRVGWALRADSAQTPPAASRACCCGAGYPCCCVCCAAEQSAAA